MHLFSAILEDSELHPHIGAAVIFGVSLAPVPPFVADRFMRLISSTTIDAAEASAKLVKCVKADIDDLVAFQAKFVAQSQLASADLERAQHLASMPVVGNEAATIQSMTAPIEATLRVQASTTRVDRLRRWLPGSAGLDLAPIQNALDEHARCLARLAELRETLVAQRSQLLEAAKIAADPVTLAGVSKIKANVKVSRALTDGRVASLEGALMAAKAALVSLEVEIGALRGALTS
jgi:hypothetical protein